MGHADSVWAIILAAGSASRAGSTKQLLPLDGKPLLQHVLDNASASVVDGIVLVLGHDAEHVAGAIETGPGADRRQYCLRDGTGQFADCRNRVVA